METKKVAIKNVLVTSVDLMGFWKWNIQNINCSICKCSLNDPGIGIHEAAFHENQDYSRYTTIYESVCSHSFHQDCIQKWLPIRNVCPLCNKPWMLEREKVCSVQR